MLSVEPVARDCGDEELGPVCVWACVGLGQQSGLGVFKLEVFVCELVAIDALSSGSVVVGEVSSLQHELGDDPVEDSVGKAISILTCAELSEILAGLRHNVCVELELDSPGWLISN